MKNMLLTLLAALMVLTLAACGSKTTDSNDTSSGTNGSLPSSDSASDTGSIADATELLNTVWGSYSEEDKFPVMGGDVSQEHTNLEGPGTYSLDDPAALDSALGFPAASIDKIDGAASLVHMMNANTFTCGAYHVAEGVDVQALASEIQNNIMTRQWICGFPDQLKIDIVEDYLVAFFGAADVTDTFQTYLTSAYPSAQVVCEEPIA